MSFITEIDARGCSIAYVGRPYVVDDAWKLEAIAFCGQTMVKSLSTSPSRGFLDEERDNLIDELNARDIEIFEVDNATMRAVDGVVSVAMH